MHLVQIISEGDKGEESTVGWTVIQCLYRNEDVPEQAII